MEFREFQLNDYPQVVALWQASGLTLSRSDDIKGLSKQLEPDNASAQNFYERLGYVRDDLVFMEKWLA